LLAFIHSKPDTSLLHSLTQRVRGKNWQWITKASLFEVALRLLALHKYRPDIIDGTCLGYLARRLLVSEVAVGGPYIDTANSPPDIATNAMIAQLFAAFASPLPNVIEFIKKALPESPGYTANHIGIWSLSWPHEILAPSDTPFASNVRLHQQSTSHGTWHVRPYSVILSTVSALCLIDSGRRQSSDHVDSPPTAIALHVRQELTKLPAPLRPIADTLWQAVAKADAKQEITMLSHLFAQSLTQRTKAQNDEHCTVLGQANFYTWIAYTVYDDCIDDEMTPNQLPIANIAQRTALRQYMSFAPLHPDIADIVDRTFDSMDTANSWELATCRFQIDGDTLTIQTIPSYGNRAILAERALGHILGPLLLVRIDPTTTARAYTATQRGLEHYLIARQLNDDLHDWVADLQKGHCSFVVAFLLQHTGIVPDTYSLQVLTEQLQAYFWETGLVALCELVGDHVQHARRLLVANDILDTDGAFFRTLLDLIEASARQSTAIRHDQQRFLDTYSTHKS
jgi:hypothetical protein